MTVAEIVADSKYNKIWLCPHEVSAGTFETNPLLRGIECTRSTVPKKLRDKEVEKHFSEDNFQCIIWINDGSLSSNEEECEEDTRSQEFTTKT